jgi:hypothetical protein
MVQATADNGQQKKRHRSPNYPTVGLREAVERVRNLYSKDGKAGAPANIAAVHIGFGKAHGQAKSVLAALKRFGLVAQINGRIVPTQRALEILNLQPDDPRRQKALREAVLEPSIYRELIEQHKDTGWPATDVLASELTTYRNFNPNAVNSFVKDLRDSIEFAHLSDTSMLEPEQEGGPNVPETRDSRSEAKGVGGISPGEVTAKGGSTAKPGEISLPVGVSSEGQVVFAHIRFDSPLKKELLVTLRSLLEAMEKAIP